MTTTTTTSPATTITNDKKSRWPIILLIAFWTLLTARLVLAFANGQSLKDDSVSLPTLGLFVITAILGSRFYSLLLSRK